MTGFVFRTLQIRPWCHQALSQSSGISRCFGRCGVLRSSTASPFTRIRNSRLILSILLSWLRRSVPLRLVDLPLPLFISPRRCVVSFLQFEIRPQGNLFHFQDSPHLSSIPRKMDAGQYPPLIPVIVRVGAYSPPPRMPREEATAPCLITHTPAKSPTGVTPYLIVNFQAIDFCLEVFDAFRFTDESNRIIAKQRLASFTPLKMKNPFFCSTLTPANKLFFFSDSLL